MTDRDDYIKCDELAKCDLAGLQKVLNSPLLDTQLYRDLNHIIVNLHRKLRQYHRYCHNSEYMQPHYQELMLDILAKEMSELDLDIDTVKLHHLGSDHMKRFATVYSTHKENYFL